MRYKLYHATPKDNVESIKKNGLVPKGAFVSLSEEKDSWIKPGYALFEVDVRGLNLYIHTYLPELDEIAVWGKIDPSRLKLLGEEEKPLPCPFCGCECDVVDFDGINVVCEKC